MELFISYSWDNEEHKKWVKMLADKLRVHGIDVTLDQYDVTAGKNINLYMEKSITSSKYVLVVMTPNYKIKSDSRTGGVGYEYTIINYELFENQKDNVKFIPILREGNHKDSVPVFLKSFLYIDFRDDNYFNERYDDLLRQLYKERNVKPMIGKKPELKSKIILPPDSSFFDKLISQYFDYEIHPAIITEQRRKKKKRNLKEHQYAISEYDFAYTVESGNLRCTYTLKGYSNDKDYLIPDYKFDVESSVPSPIDEMEIKATNNLNKKILNFECSNNDLSISKRVNVFFDKPLEYKEYFDISFSFLLKNTMKLSGKDFITVSISHVQDIALVNVNIWFKDNCPDKVKVLDLVNELETYANILDSGRFNFQPNNITKKFNETRLIFLFERKNSKA